MNIEEVLEMIAQALESGRPGAAFEITTSTLLAMRLGKKYDFFNNHASMQSIIDHAQHIALEKENFLKRKQQESKAGKK